MYLPILILSVNNGDVWIHLQFILFLIGGYSSALKENKNDKRLERYTRASITLCKTSSTIFTILPKNWRCYLIVLFGGIKGKFVPDQAMKAYGFSKGNIPVIIYLVTRWSGQLHF